MKRPRLRLLIDQLKSVPCFDCKKQFDPVCMDFDHRPEEVKSGAISKFLNDEDALRAEIAKCDVVCACCHRLRTKSRGVSLQTKARIKSTLSNPEIKRRITQAQQSPSASLKRRRSWDRTAKTPEYQSRMRSAAASVAQIKSQKMKEIWAAKRLRRLVSFDRKTWAGLLWGDQK